MKSLQGRSDFTPKQRLEMQSVRDETTGCLLLQKKPTSGKGYCQIRVNGVLVLAHKAAWFMAGNSIRKNEELDHLCNNPRCIEITHLEAVTRAENCRRSYQRGRQYVPRKLDLQKAVEICQAYLAGNITQAKLAAQYAVAPTTVQQIVRGTRWKGALLLAQSRVPANDNTESSPVRKVV